MTTENNGNRAKHLLKHYLKFGLDAAGYRWDSDNASEVDELVDDLIAAGQPAPQPAPQPTSPDMIAQAGELMKRYMFGDRISDLGDGDIDQTIVIASAVLAVAGELRELRNVLAMAMSEGSDADGSPISALRIDTGA